MLGGVRSGEILDLVTREGFLGKVTLVEIRGKED